MSSNTESPRHALPQGSATAETIRSPITTPAGTGSVSASTSPPGAHSHMTPNISRTSDPASLPSISKPQATPPSTTRGASSASHLIHSMLHSGSAGSSLSTTPAAPIGAALGTSPATSPPPHHTTSNLSSGTGGSNSSFIAPEKLPSKPQQLLNKLKLGRKPTPVSIRDGSVSTITGGAPANPQVASLASALSAGGGLSSSVIGPNSAGAAGGSQALLPAPPGFAMAQMVDSDAADFEELSPHSSVPNNPLAPLLTPFRMMKPLMPAVASRAVAGIKRPWQRRAAAAAAAMPVPLVGEGGAVGSSTDSTPPMGYLWVWMGSFRRWQRRFIVASEAPGVLLMYKGMNMKGKVLSISLRNVDIHEDASDPRQLKIITPTGYIFLRASLPEERVQWMACLRESVRLYRANQGLVEKLKDKGLLPQTQPEDVTGNQRPRLTGGSLGGVISMQEATEMDMEQRRRIRIRLAEKLSEITPFQREVERHMGLLSSQLLSVVTGLNVRLPSLTPSNSMMRVASFNHATAQRTGSATATAVRPHAPHAPPTDTTATQHVVTELPTRSPLGMPNRVPLPTQPRAASSSLSAEQIVVSEPQPPSLPQVAGGDAAAQASEAVRRAARSTGGSSTAAPHPLPPRLSDGNSGPSAPPGGPAPPLPLQVDATDADLGPDLSSHSAAAGADRGELPTPTMAPAATAGGVSGSMPPRQRVTVGDVGAGSGKLGGGLDLSGLDRALGATAIKSHMRPPAAKAQNLQQAFGQLLEAVRYALQSQATRIAELETENMAFQGALTLLKTQQEKAWRARAGTNGSFTAAGSHNAAGTSTLPAQPSRMREQLTEGSETCDNDDDDDSDSSCLDDGGGGGDDACSVMTADEDAFDVVEAFDDGVDYTILDNPGDEQEGMSEVPNRSLSLDNKLDAAVVAEACEEMAETSAQVLNALEVVRQVEYVERLEGSKRITKALATHEPPDKPPVDGAVTEKEDGEESDETDDDEDDEAGGVPRSSSQSRGRSRLPAPRPLGKGFSIWSLLKNMIGKDLTRLTMPATINEPTSTLQRLAESMEYREVLDRAALEPNSVDRLMHVAVWTMSCYASQALRDGKPFNPLLGETYEWRSHDGESRYVCEQVSHHPPVLAYVADSAKGNWELQGEIETKSKFWGKSAEVLLWGCEALKLKQWGEEYRWNRANICVQDVILGNYWIEVYGKVRVENTTTGEVAALNLKPCRRRMADRGKLEGTVSDARGQQVWLLTGSTADKIYAQLTPQAAQARGLAAQPPPQLIWEKLPYPPDAAEQYWFSKFAIQLNDPADRIAPHLPPTDSRFRPDQRALEVGEWNRATTEKLRLEEKQRQARRERAKLGIPYFPAWFKQVDQTTLTHLPDQPGFAWSFTGDYWQHSATKEWSQCPDLYSMHAYEPPRPSS